MTDITELAQREKFEAWFKSSFHPDKTGPYIKDQLYFAWKAAGAEMVEALEKAHTKADVYDMLRDDYGLREKGVGLADFVDWQAKRIAELEAELERERKKSRRVMSQIAELESRTVKLPQRHSMPLREDFNEDYHTEMAYKADEVQASLAATGIKWEAE
ncbi:hypothetical protein ML097_005223 [Klebsiella pneumoniae]|nr:hypothetical protein [Klebsiella pneumoniae]